MRGKNKSVTRPRPRLVVWWGNGGYLSFTWHRVVDVYSTLAEAEVKADYLARMGYRTRIQELNADLPVGFEDSWVTPRDNVTVAVDCTSTTWDAHPSRHTELLGLWLSWKIAMSEAQSNH